jgi:hypothetical protein
MYVVVSGNVFSFFVGVSVGVGVGVGMGIATQEGFGNMLFVFFCIYGLMTPYS